MHFRNSIYILLLCIFSTAGFAQDSASKKLDKIILKNYDVIEAVVTKVSDDAVEFHYPDESLVNSMKTAEIAKIDFANGRSQTFDINNAPPLSNSSGSGNYEALDISENMIAVLPIPYVNAQSLESSEEMAKFAQNDTYDKLLDKSSNILPLKVQDIRTTNALLRKAGIDHTNIDEIPIDDLHKILGVDNIVAAKVSYTIAISENSSTYSSRISKTDRNRVKGNSSSSTTTSETDTYNYHVYFDMYRNNEKIYSQSREPILYFKDSWMDSVKYLLKRSPIYSKRK